VTSNAFPVTVTATSQGTVTGISPAQGLIGTTVSNITITGSGFGSSPTVNAGSGITVTYISRSNTSITANFAIASTAPVGNSAVVVTTTAGAQLAPVNFYVQIPTSLSVLSVTVLPDGVGAPFGCGGNSNYGIKVDVKYQVLDQNTQPIQSAQMTPHEQGTGYAGAAYDNNIGPVAGYPTSSATTASDGTFHDVPQGVCANLPIPLPGRTATQNITTILPGGSSPAVRSQTLTVTAPGSQSFGHGTIKNSISSPGSGSDISATR